MTFWRKILLASLVRAFRSSVTVTCSGALFSLVVKLLTSFEKGYNVFTNNGRPKENTRMCN
jgi:hypothetical protein